MASGNQNDLDSFIQLIKDLRYNSQDDTDPNNVVIQKFQSIVDTVQLSEVILISIKFSPMQWAGTSIPANFKWGHVAGSLTHYYRPQMGALKCVLML